MTASKLALEDLHEIVSVRFEEVQTSLANHRKNCVALYKTHVQAGKITQPKKNGEAKLLGEIAFGDVFIDMVNRVLVIKKGPCADRVVKFVGSYVKFVNDKGASLHFWSAVTCSPYVAFIVLEERQKQASSSSASPPKDDDDESLASRFVSRLLQWVLQGFEAKNKIVRQRTAHIVSEMISHIGEIEQVNYAIQIIHPADCIPAAIPTISCGIASSAGFATRRPSFAPTPSSHCPSSSEQKTRAR